MTANEVTPRDVASEQAVAAEGQTLMRYTGPYAAPTGLYMGKYAGFKGQDPIGVDEEDVPRMLTFGVWEVVKADAGGDASALASDVTQQTQADVQSADDALRAGVDNTAQGTASEPAVAAEADGEEDTPRRHGARKARADKE